MAYTTIKKSSDYFNTKLWTGTESSNSITGVGFQPDMVWIKNRSTTHDHRLADAVRGVPNLLYPSTTDVAGNDGNAISSLDSDGFTVGTSTAVNGNGNNIVAWNWKANGAGSANTDGSISSTVSANTTSGFSIVSYTGTGSNATVGHGLGVAPKVVIVKNRTNTQGWGMYNKNIGAANYLALNTTAASSSASTIWNSTDPTTTVFSVGTSGWTNDSGYSYISYCFAEKQGYSKFGSYTGNGSTDGTFVYTGFKPAFILVKQSNSTASWTILDNKRDSFNVTEKRLFPDGADAEVVSANGNTDFLSNGVKMRIGHANINASGSTYIYMAFAEEPLVGDNPATAR